MTGTTGLKDLRVDCIVGIYPHERAATQTVMLDIELDYDFAAPAASDAIADAVDYDGVAAGVTGLLQARQFQLIEAMIPRGVLSATLQRFVAGVKRINAGST